MNRMQTLVAQRREHQILAEGLGIEICLACGDRDGAQRHRKEMYALIAARNAQLDAGPCYFAASGDIARIQAQAQEAVRG